MSLQRIASAAAHQVAAAVVAELELPPDVEIQGTATIDNCNIRIIVIIVKDTPDSELTDLQKDVMEAASFEFVSMKKLAKTSGYHYGSHFRTAVNVLVDAGLLTRNSAGIGKPS